MIRRLLGLAVKAVLLWVVLSLLMVAVYAVVPPPTTWTMLTDPRGATRQWRPLSAIAPAMPRAAIAAEDSRFCEHDGFDRAAIEAAIRHNVRGGTIHGGSTISQQTAKNVFLWQGGGLFRKALEAWFTLLIETVWGKRRIMEVYLNVAETGIGTYGVEAAAQRYFHKSAAALSPAEAARIAAVLPSPKKRPAVAPAGFTRRYGNRISRRIGVVKRSDLDACLSG